MSKESDTNKFNLKLEKTYDYCALEKAQMSVIFLHGIAADSSTFSDTLSFLEGVDAFKPVRFITFDLLGSGKSRKSDELNYDYTEQLSALHSSIQSLNIDTPLIMVGHSMGSLILARYLKEYSPKLRHLILVSTPVYTKKDLKNPAFKAAIEVFRDALAVKMRNILKEKSFNNSIANIVTNPDNYEALTSINVPTTLIYGELDQFIAQFNYPKLLKANSNLCKIKTPKRHGMSRDKYEKIGEILKSELKSLKN
ncbi:MAG: alpha/beta hydrolase [Candidatus Saccharibacteria bacterium]|nr:alpha/beta hydrolase [Candidatus Saccharibacteria bacterium]